MFTFEVTPYLGVYIKLDENTFGVLNEYGNKIQPIKHYLITAGFEPAVVFNDAESVIKYVTRCCRFNSSKLPFNTPKNGEFVLYKNSILGIIVETDSWEEESEYGANKKILVLNSLEKYWKSPKNQQKLSSKNKTINYIELQKQLRIALLKRAQSVMRILSDTSNLLEFVVSRY